MKYYKHSFLSHLSAPHKVDKKKLFTCARKVSQRLLKSHAKVCLLLKEKAQRKVYHKRHLSLMILPLSLTGCMGIYEGGFECPAGTGVGCKSISEVNTMVNRNQLPGIRSREIETDSYDHRSTEFSQLGSDSLQIWYAPSMYNGQEKASCPVSIDEEPGSEIPNKCKSKDVQISA